MTMKKVVLVLLGISIVCNLVLAGIAITNYVAPNDYVDTAEKACVLGKAYLELNFPDFDVYNSRYEYFAVYYISPEMSQRHCRRTFDEPLDQKMNQDSAYIVIIGR